MDAYALIAERYKRLAVLAANCQGLAGIERTILQVNPRADVFSAAALPLVLAVEDGMEPHALVEKFFLAKLMDYFAANGAEAVILGCTHFPYFREALAKKTELDLIDPADISWSCCCVKLNKYTRDRKDGKEEYTWKKRYKGKEGPL